ncbi:MAG: anaerobic ribonucleoside-triphosphate reductase [Bacillota bacterium]|nr:anaerobic ribonucleoside-triphosphate reductase [Bacillota bacterium]
MSIIITGNADPKEAQAYVDYLENKYNRKLDKLDIKIDGEYADLDYTFSNVPFERIRRITGYLVGTMDNWNDAKSAEEADRVKHSLGEPSCSLEDLS